MERTGVVSKGLSFMRKGLNTITVEPLLFLYALGFAPVNVYQQPLYFDKICNVGAPLFTNGTHFNQTVCDGLDSGKFSEEQEFVQKTYTTMNLVTLFLKGVPAVIFALFIGPWSDRFGRKMLMMLPLIGYFLFDIWYLINSIFFDTFVTEWLMLEIFQYWPGGFQCLFLGAYSYVTDSSSEEDRTLRIALCDFFFFIGLSTGSGELSRPPRGHKGQK